MGQIFTFYSYKGGVGRSMALANTAALMARWGYKTLMVDWDLEAPGLENFFEGYAEVGGAGPSVRERAGVVDLLSSVTPGGVGGLSWRDLKVELRLSGGGEPLHLLSAGRRDADYFKKVRNFDVGEFYSEKEGGAFIESLRREWKEQYDLVLLDSRTGITDIGGICTIQLPDILVLLFTATEQGLSGTIDVARKATLARQSLPFDRLKLLTVPIASRFDVDKEFQLSKEWLRRAAEKLEDLFADWLPTNIRRLDMLELTKIPYKAYFSFGEKLAVMEENAIAPDSLAYSYTTLAALLANRLAHLDQLRDSRDDYVRLAAKSEPPAPDETSVITPEMLEEHRKWHAGLPGGGKRLVLTGAKLGAQDLPKAWLNSAVLVETDLSASNLVGARLLRADLSNSDLQGANLAHAMLWEADLHGANLTDANLQAGWLEGANLQGTDLRGADLSRADLRGANLTDTSLTDARLEVTDLRGANLQRAVLTGAVGLSAQQLAGTDLSQALVPDGLLPREEFDLVRTRARLLGWLGLTLVAVCVFALACVNVTTDRQIIVPEYSSPIFRGLPLRAPTVYLVLPVFLCVLYFVFHLGARTLWRRLGRMPAVFPEGVRLDDRLPRWMGGSLRANFALLGKGRPRSERVGGRFLSFLIWWLTPATLLILWARYLVRHDLGSTLLQLAMLTAAATGAMLFRDAATKALRGKIPSTMFDWRHLLREKGWWLMGGETGLLARLRTWAYLPFFVGLFLAVLSYGVIRGIPVRDSDTRGDAPAWYSPFRLAPSIFTLGGLSPYAPYAELKNETFNGLDLAGRDLRYAGAQAAYFKDANLFQAELSGINLRYADLRGTQFQYADLRRSNLMAANLENASLNDARLGGAKLAAAWLVGARLNHADLTRAELQGVMLQSASLEKTDLTGADLQDARMAGAWLYRSKLAGAYLRGADLSRANFLLADLKGATLDGANLTDADLTDADLTGTSLRGADLTGALITKEQLASAVTDAQTKFSGEDYQIRLMVSQTIASVEKGAKVPDAARLIAASYRTHPEAVVGALLDQLRPDEDANGYIANLFVVTTLASIRPNWQGTPEQLARVEALTRSRYYADPAFDPAFKARVGEALSNFRPVSRSVM